MDPKIMIAVVAVIFAADMGWQMFQNKKRNELFDRLSSFLAKKEYDAFDELIDSPQTRKLFPAFNIAFLKLNEAMLKEDREAVDRAFGQFDVRMNGMQKEALYKKGFYYYLGLEDKAKTRVYYDRHHALMDRLCDIHKRIVLFDMHSYSDEIVPPSFLRGGEPTPDVCIGTDARYTPERLAALAERRFREAGYSVRRDYPYSGCYVPNTVLSGAADCDLLSLMLEFNKRIYLSHEGKQIRGVTAGIQSVLAKIAVDCIGM